jgi:hypothetical protein
MNDGCPVRYISCREQLIMFTVWMTGHVSDYVKLCEPLEHLGYFVHKDWLKIR